MKIGDFAYWIHTIPANHRHDGTYIICNGMILNFDENRVIVWDYSQPPGPRRLMREMAFSSHEAADKYANAIGER